MRSALSVTAALALAGCWAHAPVPDQPNESVVEGQFEKEQDALDNSIAEDAQGEKHNEVVGGVDGATGYRCEDGTVVQVVYGADDGTARITLEGKTLALLGVPAASGSKYATQDGIGARNLTWWEKGDTAMLIQAPRKVVNKRSPRLTMTNCRRTD